MTEVWQPPFELDDFQVEATDFTVKNGRVFILLPVGSGKTCIPLGAIRQMPVKSLTVLCTGNALYTWYRQIKQWLPEMAERMIVIEKLNAKQRAIVWNDPYYKIIIAKVGTFARDYESIKTVPTMVVLDETQRYFRKYTTKTSEKLIEYVNNCKFAACLSGNGISRGRQEFFPVLRALRLKRFSSYWRFVNMYMYTNKTAFGMEILGPRHTPQFREITADTIFRPKSEIKLPEVLRQRLPVEMTEAQANLYGEMKGRMFSYLESGELLMASNTLALTTRLRQILCCPKILDPSIATYGAGIENILDHMEEEEDRRHCVWFTPFTDAIPYMQEALLSKNYDRHVVFRHGMDMDDLKVAEEAFRSDPHSVAICSIMFSQSFELETGNPAYFPGYSFNPDDNEQAEGRLRRKTTQRAHVNAYYVQNLGTYDERTLEVLGRKSLNVKVDMQDVHAIREVFR